MSKYPECEKMFSVSAESQSIGAFLDWCLEQRYELRGWNDTYQDCPGPLRMSSEQLLAKYFEIDLNKVERERQAMLHELAERQQ